MTGSEAAEENRAGGSGRAVRAVFWAGLSQFLLFGVGVVKGIVLARLVGPESFGVIAGATVWASYLGVLRLDLRVAVLRGQEDPRTLGVQLWLENISALSAFVAVGGLALAWPGAMSAEAWGVTLILLALAQLETLSSTATYVAEKRLRQDLLGQLAIAGALVGGVVAVPMALLGRPLGAVVADVVLSAVVARIGILVAVGGLPRPAWDAAEARAQLRLGWTLWSSAILGKIAFQFDDWLVYNVHRPHPVAWQGAGVVPTALYARAYNIGKLPMDLVGAMVARPALALYADAAGRGPAALVRVRMRLTAVLAWSVLGASAVLLVAAEEIVSVLGPRWTGTVPLLYLLALFVVTRPLFQNNAQTLLAVGGEKAFRRTMLVQVGVILLAGPFAVHAFGAAGVAVVVSGMSALGLAVSEGQVARYLGAAAARQPYAAPVAAGATAVLGLVVLAPWLPVSPWLSAGAKVLVCLVVFGGALAMFGRDVARDAWTAVRQGLARG
jgi:O-antigen/teichoic acid export membrane protein